MESAQLVISERESSTITSSGSDVTHCLAKITNCRIKKEKQFFLEMKFFWQDRTTKKNWKKTYLLHSRIDLPFDDQLRDKQFFFSIYATSIYI